MMPVSVSTSQSIAQRVQQDAAQSIGSFRFGDNNLGTASGSAGVGGLTPLTWGLLIVAALVGLWIWKR